jgi:hypothetical protein
LRDWRSSGSYTEIAETSCPESSLSLLAAIFSGESTRHYKLAPFCHVMIGNWIPNVLCKHHHCSYTLSCLPVFSVLLQLGSGQIRKLCGNEILPSLLAGIFVNVPETMSVGNRDERASLSWTLASSSSHPHFLWMPYFSQFFFYRLTGNSMRVTPGWCVFSWQAHHRTGTQQFGAHFKGEYLICL